MAAYVLAIPLAFVDSRIAHALYVLVALAWLVPDRRVEPSSEESGVTVWLAAHHDSEIR